MRILFLTTISLILLFSSCGIRLASLDDSTAESTELNRLSEEFLKKVRNGEDTKNIQDQLANISFTDLMKGLETDGQKLAFWVNIYNAYIQVVLEEHPEYYENVGDFFSRDQIQIAGNTLAFSKIEHGIIRKSQLGKGLGYVQKWFPGKLERKLRVKKRDYRVHFALNCGAKDCPPIPILTPSRLNEQLDKATGLYLNKSSIYDADSQEVAVTALFSWFRGDFGGKSGTKEILKKHDVIPSTKGVSLKYKDYDWTLYLGNFIDV